MLQFSLITTVPSGGNVYNVFLLKRLRNMAIFLAVVVWPYAHNRLKKMRESTCRKNPGIKIRHCCLVHCKSLTANMIEFSCN